MNHSIHFSSWQLFGHVLGNKRHCFVISQQPEPVVKEAPHEVLVRANAKGILDRIGSNQLTRKEQHGHTNRMTKITHARTSQPHLSVSIQSKNREIKGSNSTTLCGHQEFNRRQSSQGGHVYFSSISITQLYVVMGTYSWLKETFW